MASSDAFSIVLTGPKTMNKRSAELYLTIDQGGHASRAIVFNQHGEILAQAEHAINTFTPQDGWVEHSPQEVLASIRLAMREAVQTLGRKRNQIKAAGLATQRSSIVCWHRASGKALSPVLSWQDRRQQTWLEQFTNKNEMVHRRTGLFLSPHYGASKLRWCLDNLADVSAAHAEHKLLAGPLASYLVFNLTRERYACADPANASRTLLWNIQSQNWDAELCEMFDVPMAILPECNHSCADFGHLDIDGQSIPLQLVTGDQPAAMFAWGQPDDSRFYINIGTGAFIQRITPHPCHNKRLLTGIAYQDAQQQFFTLEGTVNGAARALQWLKIGDLEQELPKWLDKIDRPPLFINTISGLGSPWWLPCQPARFIGETKHCPQNRAVAVLESIVFLIQRNIEEMEQSLPPVNEVIVSGGLSQLNGLCQRLANLSDKAIRRPQVSEATAQGLGFLAAGQPDHWPAFEAQQTFYPEPQPLLLNRYQAWRTRMAKLGPV